jgi:large subunit ribosomal protein L25
MEKVALKAQLREGRGKGSARSLRRGGSIPAVIYGLGDPTPISLDRRELSRIINAGGGGSLLTVLVPGSDKERMAILKDYQLDPIKNELLHADLLEVAMGKAIHINVPVVLVGTAEGVKDGGILQQPTHEISVECLPGNIPEHIEVDMAPLGIGASVHVSDLVLPEGVKALTEPETVILTIAPPISAEKLDEMLSKEAALEVKEPELVTKPKKEEE